MVLHAVSHVKVSRFNLFGAHISLSYYQQCSLKYYYTCSLKCHLFCCFN